MLRKALKARFVNRTEGNPRELIFLSGDIHVGCIFDIHTSNPDYNIVSLTSSGISAKQEVNSRSLRRHFCGRKFQRRSGIKSTLRDIIPDFNFGVIQVLPTGDGAQINPIVAHEGNSFAAGLNFARLI